MTNKKFNLKEFIKQNFDFLKDGIWLSDTKRLSLPLKFVFTLLRALIVLITGMFKNRIPVQAAALSYTTLLALGPLVAVVMIFSSKVFTDEEFIYKKITQAMVFVMPAVKEVVHLEQEADQTENVANADGASAQTDKVSDEELRQINPEIFAMIKKISKGSTSLGIFGTVTVVFTCLLLCVNMESAFNAIWNVKKGRGWIMRISFYWMLITLGVVFGLSGMTFLAGSQLSGLFKNIPFISQYAGWATQLIGMTVLVLTLTLFYKLMPNTLVKAVPALIGAILVTCLLVANNKLSFLYMGKVVEQNNFYGYFALVPIAMFCLYIFWLFILTGSQVTYAIQNRNLFASSKLWERTGFKVRELIALAIYSEISAAFCTNKPAPAIKELSDKFDIPSEIIQNLLSYMSDRDLVCEIELASGEIGFKPSHNPDNITLADFARSMTQNEGDENIQCSLSKKNPAVKFAVSVLENFGTSEFGTKTIKEINSI